MAPFSGTTSRRTFGLIDWRASAAVLVWLALGGCRERGHAWVYVVAGPDPSQHVEFRPASSYAEYVVYPGARTELKITLASYAASCDAFVAQTEKDASATITVIAPAGSELGPGTYQWAGHEAHGGSEQQPERPYALPTVRLGRQSWVLPAGGELELKAVNAKQDARVRGILGFDFPGDGEHVATSLKGSFEAKLCRVRL